MSTPSHAPVLVLDVGRVCIALHQEQCAAILGFDSLDALHAAQPDAAGLARDLETGKLSDEAFIDRIATSFQQSPDRIRRAWMANIGDELPGIAAIVRQALEAGLKVVLMSDTSAMHADQFFANLSFRDQLAGTVYSHEIGACKPDAPMYEAIEQRFCAGRPPLLFADDKAPNLATAEARGWGTCHVVDYDLNHLANTLREKLAGR
jgi:2-haloacid dehalogenase